MKKTWIQRETRRSPVFALDGIYIGRRKGDDLIYAGKVHHGLDKTSAADLQKRLKPLIRKMQPYRKRIAHNGIWVEPKLLAEIEYRAKSAEGKVRACGSDGRIRSLLAAGGQATGKFVDDSGRTASGGQGARS